MFVRFGGRLAPLHPRVGWRSIRAEAQALPRALGAWLALLGILALLGALAAIRSLVPGDKGIGTTPTFEWGLLIAGYVFFAITTSGLCLASSLGTVFGIDRFRPLERRHAVLAVLCLAAAFGIIALDLHYPVRLVVGAVFNPTPSSPMWWMGVFYGVYFGSLLLEVWSMFRGHPGIHGFACLFSSVMAVLAPATLGAVFGVLAARSFWHGPFTPMLMVASAFLSGTALLGIVFCAVDRFRLASFERAASAAIPAIRLILAVALVLVACLLARQVVVGYLSDDAGLARATGALVAGPLAPAFWIVRIAGGLVVPLLLIALPWTRTAAGLFAAASLAIVGVFTDRLTFVAAGQIAPTTAVSGVVSAPYAAYTPSLVEIGIMGGAAAFVALAYTLAERYMDLGETDVHAVLSPAAIRGYRDRLRRRGARAPLDAVETAGMFSAAAATEVHDDTGRDLEGPAPEPDEPDEPETEPAPESTPPDERPTETVAPDEPEVEPAPEGTPPDEPPTETVAPDEPEVEPAPEGTPPDVEQPANRARADGPATALADAGEPAAPAATVPCAGTGPSRDGA